jgi:methyl-accepting chemotaxis protein
MEKLVIGDLAADVTEASQVGEIGAMGRTVEVFKNNALSMRRLQEEQEELKSKAEQEKKAALAALADNFETRIRGIVDVLSGAATRMQSTARSMSDTADSTRQQSLAVASGDAAASTQSAWVSRGVATSSASIVSSASIASASR